MSRGGQEMESSEKGQFLAKESSSFKTWFHHHVSARSPARLYTTWSCLHTSTCAGSFSPHSPGYKVLDGGNLVCFFLFLFLVAPCSMWDLSSLITESVYAHAQSCPILL